MLCSRDHDSTLEAKANWIINAINGRNIIYTVYCFNIVLLLTNHHAKQKIIKLLARTIRSLYTETVDFRALIPKRESKVKRRLLVICTLSGID